MKKCLRLVVAIKNMPNNFLKSVVQKHAVDNGIEGTVQSVDEDTIKIIVCGKKDSIDSFLDLLHKELASIASDDLHIEPFIKDRDYRGVFRVIE